MSQKQQKLPKSLRKPQRTTPKKEMKRDVGATLNISKFPTMEEAYIGESETDYDCAKKLWLARVDPFGYKGDLPCSMREGSASRTIKMRKFGRYAFSAGQGTSVSDGYVAVNPYLALAEDARAVAYTDQNFLTPLNSTAWSFLTTTTGVNNDPVPGGFFTAADLAVAATQNKHLMPRVVSCAVRISGRGTPLTASGDVLYRQVPGDSSAAAGDITKFPDAVSPLDLINDTSKPITIFAPNTWYEVRWTPGSHQEGQTIPSDYYSTATITSKGCNLVIGVRGAQNGYPLIAEVVVFGEYGTMSAGVGMATNAISNAAVSQAIDTLLIEKPISTYGEAEAHGYFGKEGEIAWAKIVSAVLPTAAGLAVAAGRRYLNRP